MTAASADAHPGSIAAQRTGVPLFRSIDLGGVLLAVVTIVAAILWIFPVYWALITSVKPESQVVQRGLNLWPQTFTLQAFNEILFNTQILRWYFNSLVTSIAVMVLVLVMGATCGYALSQLRFPGRRILWWIILASFMIPIPALIINHYVLMWQLDLLNNWLGVILPQLIAPIVVIVYKNFFDSVPKELREAAVMDSTSEFRMLFRIFLPMNWGVSAALAIITFIAAWNNFLWPFLAVTQEQMMNVSVGITQTRDSFGVRYARLMASAVLTGMPVIIVYLIFQRRVTQAIMLSAGIKG